MFSLFDDVKKQISTSGATTAKVGSVILFTCKLCMMITTLACILVTAKTYIGDNINCITGYEKQEHQAIETYCFITSTFTLVDLENNNKNTAHPGVGPITRPHPDHQTGDRDSTTTAPEDDLRRHAYYQWVPMVLFLQAAVFYFPIWIWNLIDKGYFQAALCGLDKVHIGDYSKEINSSAKFFAKSLTHHRSYAIAFLLCEITAFAISVGNLFFTNTFLGGQFFKFGPSALKYLGRNATDPSNPLNEIFPKVAKCTWYKYGPSGTIQQHDSLCVLPLNIVNEKTYIFLWIMYIVAAIVCGVFLLIRILLFLLPRVRNSLLVHRARRPETKRDLMTVLLKCNYGDWFLMYNFRTSMVYFREWVHLVKEEILK
ncbi:hypothetical protein Pmani_018934 [Petrolisthes manimaculis]|uniref:Innexin n=1 Tax=Petrolisthes manimaculis TaxID=1843537 RepID=A0AAE1U4G2_9EUCA|nr:hypothetical protein Pmani_018934 [Petrolisthes manimaculis]